MSTPKTKHAGEARPAPKSSGVYRLGGPALEVSLAETAADLCWAKLDAGDVPAAVGAYAEFKSALRALRVRDRETRRAGALDFSLLVAVRELDVEDQLLLKKFDAMIGDDDLEITPA